MPPRATISDLLDLAQRQVDRVVPPDSRQHAYTRTKEFATARPLLFSLIVAQVIFSAMPVLFFLTCAFSALFALSCVFLLLSLFWTGLAVFVLVPVIVLTSTMALFTWGFGVASFSFSRSAYKAMQTVTIAADEETRAPPRRDSRFAAPGAVMATSSSSSPSSWDKIEDQDIKQEAEGSTSRHEEPVHPAPGSDVDALEP